MQSMEGTLERKHKLQLGGKKVRKAPFSVKARGTVSKCKTPQSATHTLILFSQAPSRGWNSYHAVLYRHTLCFYQDRKDTLRVSSKKKYSKEPRRTKMINN